MATTYWIGGTSTNPATAANYSNATLPADGGTLIFNDQADQACGGGDLSLATPNEKEIAVIVEKSYPFTVGVSGTPFEINDFSLIHFAGSGIGTSYFDIGANDPGDINDVVLDSESSTGEILNVDGTILRWTQRNGKATIKSTATVSGRIELMSAGGSPSELTIPTGVTLTSCDIAVDGGKLSLSATALELVALNAGEIVLAGTAGITGGTDSRLEQTGGTFYWDASSSTITLAENRGGAFKTRLSRIGRTMTAQRMYGDAVVDYSMNSGNPTFTGGIQVFGSNQPIFPRGTKLTAAFVTG